MSRRSSPSSKILTLVTIGANIAQTKTPPYAGGIGDDLILITIRYTEYRIVGVDATTDISNAVVIIDPSWTRVIWKQGDQVVEYQITFRPGPGATPDVRRFIPERPPDQAALSFSKYPC